MTIPCVVIQRHKPGLYEWTVLYDRESVDGDTGGTSIVGCLASAVSGLPEPERLIEVRYRGLHMGTFERTELEECTDAVAGRIAAAYGALTHDY